MRTLPRFFIPGSITTGVPLDLPHSTAHHLKHVLRLSDGEITVFNGEGGEYRCRIAEVGRKNVTVKPLEFIDVDRRARLCVHLGLCILKKDAMDRALGRSVELGASRITPLVSEHCTVASKVIRNRVDHWRQVIIAACEQSGLNLLPILDEPRPLVDWVESTAPGLKLISLQGHQPLPDTSDFPDSTSLLVGPEGGFSTDEINTSVNAGFVPVTFGERVLRAETAPLVALSVLNRLRGDY